MEYLDFHGLTKPVHCLYGFNPLLLVEGMCCVVEVDHQHALWISTWWLISF